MGRIAEYLFDLVYVAGILLWGIVLLVLDTGVLGLLPGLMAVTLGVGDLLHLLPRLKMLRGNTVKQGEAGLGMLATSVTSATYYLFLFYVWKRWYLPHNVLLFEVAIWMLFLWRIGLCISSRNLWREDGYRQNRVLRNLPFILMGLLLCGLFAWKAGSGVFHMLPLAVGLSFLCYIAVLICARRWPKTGMLMIPKTLLYLWIQWMLTTAALSL